MTFGQPLRKDLQFTIADCRFGFHSMIANWQVKIVNLFSSAEFKNVV